MRSWSQLVRTLVFGKFLFLILAAPALAGPCRLAVLGDSLAAGYGVDLAQSFPARLEEALRDRGQGCEVINAGVSGDTSAGGLARLDWVLADEPTHLMVELGGNDGLRALPVETLRANLQAIIDRAEAEGVPVFLAGMEAPPNLGDAYTRAFRGVYQGLADQNEVAFDPFFLAGAIEDSSLMQPDGIHPNAQGVERIVERLAPIVAAWLRASGGEAS